MPYAINLRSDDKSADSIRSLWRECERLENSPSMAGLNYPPHITLTIYDDIDPDRLYSAFESAVSGLPTISARFEHLDTFVTPSAVVVWAAPILGSEVYALHERIHSLIEPEMCRPHYRPASWVPHCSLATAIELRREEEALETANRSIEPFEVVFDVVDCVSFLPVQVLRERNLPATA